MWVWIWRAGIWILGFADALTIGDGNVWLYQMSTGMQART